MARIRSVHPGLFNDDEFIELSSDAQILLIGLWTEADDQGVFEWKPGPLKRKLRGGKDGSIEPLLDELVKHRCIKMYQFDEKAYGAIRNFREFQRPKSPNAIYPITKEIGNYTKLTPSISEIAKGESTPVAETKPSSPPPISETDKEEPTTFPPKGETSPQMEDGGGRLKGKEEGRESGADAPSRPKQGTRLTEEWKPSEELLAKLIGEGLKPDVYQRELRTFRNYWMSKTGKDATKLDWNRTFDNWMLKVKQDGRF